MNFPSIALLTDFGERDGFVGLMKSVILSKLEASVPLIDISHQIEPQNIFQASWVLKRALPYLL
jgi:S-adenosyl-L-methionine hydrolase (adenosine-forming)